MLPKIFKPIYIDNNDLIRIGSLNDGGYILSKDLTKNLNNFHPLKNKNK